MKLVSAAKLRRAQSAIIALRPYTQKLSEILSNLAGSVEQDSDQALFAQRQVEKVALVVFTSNRGLCGSFNSSLVKETEQRIRENYREQARAGNITLYCIGKKGYEQLSKHYPVAYHNELLLDAPNFHDIATLTEQLIHDFTARNIDRVEVVYNQFVNAATQRTTVSPFLPVASIPASQHSNPPAKTNYIFEPSRETLLLELIPKILKLQLFKALTDSIASEHGARMTSMAKATDNATEMLNDLRLKYNNARQSAITNELIEIISGATALDH